MYLILGDSPAAKHLISYQDAQASPEETETPTQLTPGYSLPQVILQLFPCPYAGNISLWPYALHSLALSSQEPFCFQHQPPHLTTCLWLDFTPPSQHTVLPCCEEPRRCACNWNISLSIAVVTICLCLHSALPAMGTKDWVQACFSFKGKQEACTPCSHLHYCQVGVKHDQCTWHNKEQGEGESGLKHLTLRELRACLHKFTSRARPGYLYHCGCTVTPPHVDSLILE